MLYENKIIKAVAVLMSGTILRQSVQLSAVRSAWRHINEKAGLRAGVERHQSRVNVVVLIGGDIMV